MVGEAYLREAVTGAHAAGLQVHPPLQVHLNAEGGYLTKGGLFLWRQVAIHAIGDAAVDRVLDVYEGLDNVQGARLRVRENFTSNHPACISLFSPFF